VEAGCAFSECSGFAGNRCGQQSDHRELRSTTRKLDACRIGYTTDQFVVCRSLDSPRALPGWAHLQYGFFDGHAIYLVMRGLIVAPDSTESTDAATVSFSLPQGAKVAAPWMYDEGKQAYTSTIAALVDNSIVAGKLSQVFYHEGNDQS